MLPSRLTQANKQRQQNMTDVFNQPMKRLFDSWPLAVGKDPVKARRDVSARPLEGGRCWRFAWPVDKGTPQEKGPRRQGTGNEIWIDRIYLLSAHFNKVRYQSTWASSSRTQALRAALCHGGHDRQKQSLAIKVRAYWSLVVEKVDYNLRPDS